LTQAKAEVPNLNSKEMECTICGKKMFYSPENLVHVCLNEEHGVLCYFEGDSCWFAASEATVEELGRRGIKFHFIPKHVFENAGLSEFTCEYSKEPKA
jgi:hypothetical protein